MILKTLVIVLSSVLKCSVFTLVLHFETCKAARGNTMYGDDDVGKDYKSIQDASDSASHGDTIFVYTGTYDEDVVLDRSITLVGEDSDHTSIDANGSGRLVTISAHEVTIHESTMSNAETHWWPEYDAGLSLRTHYSTLFKPKIKNTSSYDISLWSSSHNTITQNNIVDEKKKKRGGMLVCDIMKQ